MTEEQKGLSSEVVFFLGAGASVRAGVPDTYTFVKEFKNSLDIVDKNIIEIIETRLIDWKKKRHEDERIDIELLMEIIDKSVRRDDEPLLEFYKPEDDPWETYPEPIILLNRIKDFVKDKTIVTADKIKYLEDLLGFIEEYHPLDIFSVNYDLCIEQFCNVYKKSYRDGFEVEWNPNVFLDSNIDIRLYKLHGSITWYKTSSGSFVKSLIKSDKEKIELLTGEKAESLMLYPMRKWEYAEPLLENLLTLKNKLQSQSCRYVIVVGYSFRDEYIRDIFWDAARKNKELILILVDPNAFQIYSDKLEYYSIPDKIPSSLRGKVITLPFRFELTLRDLKAQYINNLKRGMNFLNQANIRELMGDTKTDWVSCLQPIAECQYVDKLDELIDSKIGFARTLRDTDNIAVRKRDIMLFNLELGNNIILLQEILFKRCFAFYINERQAEGNQALLDLATAVYRFLHSSLSIEILRNRIELRPNIQPNGSYHPAKSLYDLYFSLLNYRNPYRYDPLHKRIRRLVEFVNDIYDYLLDWESNFVEFNQYNALRKADFPQEVEEIAKLYPQVESVINQQNPEHAVITELREIVLKIERKVIKDILAKYFPEFNK